MFIVSANKKIRHSVVWFLADIKDFTKRQLYLFEYFDDLWKLKQACVLCETNRNTGVRYRQKQFGADALKTIQRESVRKLYTSEDVAKFKDGKPFGWTYALNVPVYKNGQAVANKQIRCDYHGQKELLKIVPIKTYK